MTTTKTTLKKWIHPTTGEIRIYVNSDTLSEGSKIWFTERDGNYITCEMNRRGGTGCSFNIETDIVCAELEESGVDLDKWASVLDASE